MKLKEETQEKVNGLLRKHDAIQHTITILSEHAYNRHSEAWDIIAKELNIDLIVKHHYDYKTGEVTKKL